MMSELDLAAVALTQKALPFKSSQIQAALKLLIEEKCSIPFVARYRKENTHGLEDIELIKTLDTYNDCVDLQKRRDFILKTLNEQNQLDPGLEKNILAAQTLIQLEDLYAPFKSKQKTKAQTAQEQGLEPLSKIIKTTHLDPKALEQEHASTYINPKLKITNFDEALAGASHIIVDEVARNTEVKEHFRQAFWQQAQLTSSLRKDGNKIDTHLKYKDYFEFTQKISELKLSKYSYRYLAIRRGLLEKVLKADITYDKNEALEYIQKKCFPNFNTLGCAELIKKCLSRAYTVYIHSSLSLEIKSELKKLSDEAAISIFGVNLKSLLLQSYLGQKPVLGIDPGIRTGCKLAVIDKNGNFRGDDVIYLHTPNTSEKAKLILKTLIQKYALTHIAVGNGTFGRETLEFLNQNIDDVSSGKVKAVLVNEDGASIYSASAIAREEFPDKDVTVRGAISIARRFQDPLAELVKIDPKSIGVGQYQHDVNPTKLKHSLAQVVESCVHHVGVDLNTASAPLLSHISGVNSSLAKNIIKLRLKNGGFKNRQELLKVSRFTPKVFEQATGFLRIHGGENPLDSSFIHPESYPMIEQWCSENKISIEDLIQKTELILKFENDNELKTKMGPFTHADVVKGLRSPGQDPRTEFKAFEFYKNIKSMEDLKLGVVYPGIVTNITQFGAFVDIGIKENGLIHISQMANKFVSDPLQILKIGQKVQAKLIDLDIARTRIALSLKSDAQTVSANHKKEHQKFKPSNNKPKGKDNSNSPFAALKNLKL